MPADIALPPLKTESMFEVPIWRSRVPAVFAEHPKMKADVEKDWDDGKFERHRHGYGYQSAATLFKPDNLERFPYLDTLRAAFIANVETILRRRVGLAASMPFEIHAVLGWLLVQTNEEWVNGTWHDHYPATVSGCYYLQVPDTAKEEEGCLAFQRPSQQDLFVEHIHRVRPREGDFILFPSDLMHRPEPCPSAEGLRVSINMDAYVHWLHQDEIGRAPVAPADYNRQVADSLD